MKTKLSIVLALYLVSLLNAYGQSPITYRLGVIGGANASQIKNNGGLQDILWRYNAGISLEQRFSPAVALAYELIYTRQGETVNNDYYSLSMGRTVQNKQVITFDYLALPIMLRVRPKGERAFLEIGGQVGRLITNDFYFTNPISPTPHAPLRNLNKLDWGLTGGIGYRLGKHFVLDARYYYGMKPMLSDFTTIDPQTGASILNRRDKWYNRVYSLNISYYF